MRIKLSTMIALSTLLLPAVAIGGAAQQIETVIGAKVINQGPSLAPGYTAILAHKDGKNRIFYESADGMNLFYGMLYDAAGNNLTALDAARLTGNIATPAPIVSAPPANTTLMHQVPGIDAMAVAASSHSIKEGKGKPVYVVFDPNCPYCKELHRKTRGYIGNVEIHWIPVGILTAPGGTSQQKAAAILRGGKSVMDSLDTVQPVELTVKDNVMLSKNASILSALNSNQVPLIVTEEGTYKGLPADHEIAQVFMQTK